MRAALKEELATAELNLGQARVDEFEVEKVLDLAENLLLNSAGAWLQCLLEHKQRFQQVLFRLGIEYADGHYRTQETSFLFKGLNEANKVEGVNGSTYNSRTLDSRLCHPKALPRIHACCLLHQGITGMHRPVMHEYGTPMPGYPAGAVIIGRNDGYAGNVLNTVQQFVANG